MKKIILTVTAFSILSVLTLVHSQNPGMGMHKGMGQGAMLDSSMHKEMHEHMMGGMMGGMVGASMVSTSDGGIAVMMGNHLYKYDKNLELKKEASIKVDTAAMRQWMGTMGCAKAE